MATLALAQSGDISGSTSNFTTLGTTILKLGVTLAGMAFVGLIIWGGLTLTTNRERGNAQPCIHASKQIAIAEPIAFIVQFSRKGLRLGPIGPRCALIQVAIQIAFNNECE